MTCLYDFSVHGAGGERKLLSEYRDQVVLVVNTASRCGFTDQYTGLQDLYDLYQDDGFAVLAFPCNQFANQEPATSAEVGEFCRTEFGVSFPVFAKLDVNGPNEDPVYTFLKDACPGVFGTKRIKWNFTKFLINRDGKPIKRFPPAMAPNKLKFHIQQLL